MSEKLDYGINIFQKTWNGDSWKSWVWEQYLQENMNWESRNIECGINIYQKARNWNLVMCHWINLKLRMIFYFPLSRLNVFHLQIKDPKQRNHIFYFQLFNRIPTIKTIPIPTPAPAPLFGNTNDLGGHEWPHCSDLLGISNTVLA